MSEKKSIEEILSQTLADAVFDVNTSAQSSDGMFDTDFFNLPTLDDLSEITKPADVPQIKERNILRGLGEFGSQFAQRGTETATLGLSKFAFGEAEEAETLGGKIGATLGTVAGFMAPMSGFGKIAKAGVRATSKFSGTKMVEGLRPWAKEHLKGKVKHVGKQRDSIAPITAKQTEKMFFDDVIEKGLLKKIEEFGADRTFKTVVDRNKFSSDTMLYAGRFLQKRAKELGLKIGDDVVDPKTGEITNTVLKEFSEKFAKEWDRVGARPITEFRQQLMRAVPFANEGRASAILATALEEGIAFAAVEGAMHVTNVAGGFHQHDGTEARWDEMDDVLGQAFVLGNLLGVGRFIPGGVKGGAIPNLFTQSGRAQGKLLLGYMPKMADKYNPIGTSTAAITDRHSLYNMFRHFDKLKMGDGQMRKQMTMAFENHPLKGVLPKEFNFSRANIREKLHIGTNAEKDALGQMLKDNLKTVGAYATKAWRKDFPALLRKDIVGSQLRMGYGGMILGGGPQVLFDENIMFEDKMIGFLTGYFLFKHGKEINFKQGEIKAEDMYGSWSGYKKEYGEQRAELRQIGEMWEALGVDFGKGPWASIIARSRRMDETIGDRANVSASLTSTESILNVVNPNIKDRGSKAQQSKSESEKITRDKDYQMTNEIHQNVKKHFENEGYIESSKKEIMELSEMSYKQYQDTIKNYREMGWERDLDIQMSVMQSKVESQTNTGISQVPKIVEISGLLRDKNDIRYAKSIAKEKDGANLLEPDSQGIYQIQQVPRIKPMERMTLEQLDAVDWYNKHVEHTSLMTQSIRGGAKIELKGEAKLKEDGVGLNRFVKAVQDMKKSFELEYHKNLEVEADRQILYNNSLQRFNAESFNYVLEASRFKKLLTRISNESIVKNPREQQIIDSLKDLYEVKNAANVYHSSTAEFKGNDFNRLNKGEKAFFENMLPLISRLGNTTETGQVKKSELASIDKAKVKELKEIFESEGFNLISNPRDIGAFFKTDMTDLLLRDEISLFSMPDGTGGTRMSTINDRAIISRIFATPLVKNRESRMLRETFNIFDTIDMKSFGTWKDFTKSNKFQELPLIEKKNMESFKEALDSQGMNFNQLNALNKFLEPYMLQDVKGVRAGFFRKSQEIVELPPAEYVELLQTLKYIKDQHVTTVEYPLFIKDLQQIAKSEKHEYKSIAGEINKMINKALPRQQLHIYTLLKNHKMLNEQNMLGYKKNMKIEDPKTSMENNFNAFKEDFGSRTHVENKDFDAVVKEKFLDGEFMSEIFDNPIRTPDNLFDKYQFPVKGKFATKDNIVDTRGEQLKSVFYSEYKGKDLYNFGKDLKREILENNENVNVEHLDIEVTTMMKSVNKAERVMQIDIDANNRPSNMSETTVASNKFYKTLKQVIGDDIIIINDNFIPLSKQKYADTNSIEHIKNLNESLGAENNLLVNGERIAKRRNNQSIDQLKQEIINNNPNSYFDSMPIGTFVKFPNASGGAFVKEAQYSSIARQYAKKFPDADLSKLNVLKDKDGNYYYKDNRAQNQNLEPINQMVTDLVYSDFMSKGQFKAITQSTDKALNKNIKYFVLFKNDNEFTPTKTFRRDASRLLQDSTSDFGMRKNQLLDGLNFDESNSKVFVIRDEVVPGQGYKGGNIPEMFSQKARFDKRLQENNPDLFVLTSAGGQLIRTADVQMISRKQAQALGKEKKWEIIKENFESTDFAEKSIFDGVTFEHPSLYMAKAFINGKSPESIDLVQGNKWIGKRYTDKGELEFVKSYGIKMEYFDNIFGRTLSDGTRIAQIETVSGNKTIGRQSDRLNQNIIEITDIKDLEYLPADKGIPYKPEEYPLLYTSESKDYIRKSPDNMKYFQDTEAMKADYIKDVQPGIERALEKINDIGLDSPYRESARAWYAAEIMKNYFTRGEGVDLDTKQTGLNLTLAKYGIDPSFNMMGVNDMLHRSYINGEIYKYKNEGTKTSVAPELPGMNLKPMIGSPKEGIWQYPEALPSILDGSVTVQAKKGKSNAIVIRSEQTKDFAPEQAIVLSDIVKENPVELNKILKDLPTQQKATLQKLIEISNAEMNASKYVRELAKLGDNGVSFQLLKEYRRDPNQAGSARMLFAVKDFNKENSHIISSVEGARRAEYDFDGDTITSMSNFTKDGLKELVELQTSVLDAPKVNELANAMSYDGLTWNFAGLVKRGELENKAQNFKAIFMQAPQLMQELRMVGNNNAILRNNGYTGAAIQIQPNVFLAAKGGTGFKSADAIALNRELKQLGQASLDTGGQGYRKDIFTNSENLLERLFLTGDAPLFDVVTVDWNNNRIIPSADYRLGNRELYLFHTLLRPLRSLLTAEKNDFSSGKQESSGPYSITKAIDSYNKRMKWLEKDVFDVPKDHALYKSLKDYEKRLKDTARKQEIFTGFGTNAHLSGAITNPGNYSPRNRALMEQYDMYNRKIDYSRQQDGNINEFYPQYESVIATESKAYSESLKEMKLTEESIMQLLKEASYNQKKLREAQDELASYIRTDKGDIQLGVNNKDNMTLKNIERTQVYRLEKEIRRLENSIRANEGKANQYYGENKVLEKRVKLLEDYVRKYQLPNEIKNKAKKKEKFERKEQSAWVKQQVKKGRTVSTPKNDTQFIVNQSNRMFATVMHGYSQQKLGLNTFDSMRFDKEANQIKSYYRKNSKNLKDQTGEYNVNQRNLLELDTFDRIDSYLENRTTMEQIHLLTKLMEPESNVMELQIFKGELYPTIVEPGYHSRHMMLLRYMNTRIAERNPELSEFMLSNYSKAFNESVDVFAGTATNNRFSKAMGQEFYDAKQSEMYTVDVNPVRHHAAEFFRNYAPQSTSEVNKLSRLSQYEAIMTLYGGKMFADIVNNNKILNSPIGKVDSNGNWLKPGARDENIQAQIISPERNLIFDEAMPVSSDLPSGFTGKQNGWGGGKKHYDSIIGDAVKKCIGEIK
tara:strand:- start:8712 stop:17540 length:8829 start_codon:yes stop_codon:yes gene_type:complete